MLTTRRADLAETVRMLSLHGATHDAWDRYAEHGGWHYDIVAHGFKYNLSDIQSAIGIHQLHKLDQFIGRRAEQAALYRRELGGRDYVDLPADGRLRRATSTTTGRRSVPLQVRHRRLDRGVQRWRR